VPVVVQFGVIVLTLVITAWIYWQGLHGPFLLDDFSNITSGYVADFNLEEILYSLTHNDSGDLGRPVSMLSFLFSGIVHGQGTWGYKYHNLMIHLLNGLLIFWLLIKLLPHLSNKCDFRKAVLVAGATAVFWLIHPLQVSTVLYVVQRMAQLSTFFILAALLAYVFAREQSNISNWRFYLLAYLAFPLFTLLAVFSKENGVLIPVYLLMIEYIVFGIKSENPQQKRKILIFNIIFGVIPIILGSIILLTVD
jgi:hypothetical protein